MLTDPLKTVKPPAEIAHQSGEKLIDSLPRPAL